MSPKYYSLRDKEIRTQTGPTQTWPTDSILCSGETNKTHWLSEENVPAKFLHWPLKRSFQFFSIFFLPLGIILPEWQLNSTKERSGKQSNNHEQSEVTNSEGQHSCISKIVPKDKAMALASFQRFVSITETLHRKETREKLYRQISCIPGPCINLFPANKYG